MLSGVLGTGLSVALRMELREPGLQLFADPNQLAKYVIDLATTENSN